MEDAGFPGAQALDWTAAVFKARASAAELSARDAPLLVADAFDGGRAELNASLEARDLPLTRRGLTVGRHSIVLGLLPEVADGRELADTMRQHRNQCVVARSALPSSAVLDLLLVMIGPRGSEGKDAWRAMALAIERDDRVARKLVWLRPDDPRSDAESFDAFVRRTFLAHPWEVAGRPSIVSLDDIASDFDVGDAPRDTAGRWIRLAIDLSDEPDALVEGLVDVWEGRSAR